MQAWMRNEVAPYPQGNQLTAPANGPDRTAVQNSLVRMGNLTIDLDGKAVIRDGREVRLTPTEYLLLSILAIRAGRVIDQRTLLRAVWGLGYGNRRNYLRTYIYQLRGKLEADPHHPDVIVTVGLRGYRLGAPALLAYLHGR
jgi:two-component system, OmpR family, KDP operon response regulator KdpE